MRYARAGLGCGTCRAGGTDVRWFCCFFLFWTGAFLWWCEGGEPALGTWLNGGKPLQVAFHALVIHKSRLLVWCMNSTGHRRRSFLPSRAGYLVENEKKAEFLQPTTGSTMGSCRLVVSVDRLAAAGGETEITWLILHGRLNNEANDLRRFPCCGVTGWSRLKSRGGCRRLC